MQKPRWYRTTVAVAVSFAAIWLTGTADAGDVRLKNQTGCWLTWQQLAEQLPDSVEGYTVVGEDHPLVDDSLELPENSYPTQVWARRDYLGERRYPYEKISITLSCGELLVKPIRDFPAAARRVESDAMQPVSIHGCEGFQYGNPTSKSWERIELCLNVRDAISVRVTGPGNREVHDVPWPHSFDELVKMALWLDFVALDSLAGLAHIPWPEVAQDSVFLDDYVEESWENCYLDWQTLAAFLPKLPARFKAGSTDFVQNGDRESGDSSEFFDVMVAKDYVYEKDDSRVVRVIISCGATWTHTMRQWLVLAESSDSELARRFEHNGNPAYQVVISDAPVSPTRVIGVLINDLIGVEIQGIKASSFEELWFYFAHIDFFPIQALINRGRTPWERQGPR